MDLERYKKLVEVNNCGTQSPERFYYGDNNTSWSATTSQWEDYYSLNTYGKGPVVIWDAPLVHLPNQRNLRSKS